jgi:RNA polymerase sigma-70 factor (sigma-E family)
MGRQAREAAAADSEFETFFVSHRRLYWRIAVTIVGSSAAADDVTQEAFSAIYTRWDRIRATKIEAYCRTVLVNTALAAAKRRKREDLVEAPELILRPAADPVDPAGGQDMHLDLVASLRTLPPGYRAVVALRYLDDLPVAQVAAVLGISEGTVKSQTARALALMRQQLEASKDDPALAVHRHL